ncbi:MAG: type II secretion system secretin GspD [Planctomycetes bacterium]|nr:type II secretion system secretin GspD [Planctomycetota bacterium]
MSKLLCVGFLSLLLCPIMVIFTGAQEKQPPTSDEGVTMVVEGAKLSSLLEYIARRENKPLVYDDRFPKDLPINIISPKGVTIPPDRLPDVIESILRMKGFTLITTGPVIKVIPAAEAKEHPTVITSADDINKAEWADRIVTQIIPLKFAKAPTMVNLLVQLKSKEGNIIPDTDTNSLIITEYASNIRKLNTVIKQLDEEPAEYKSTTKQLKFASAATMRATLTEYLNIMQATRPQKNITRRPFIYADDRTNSIVIVAIEEDLKQLSGLIDTFDTETGKKETSVYTYKLSNINVEDAAKILESIFVKQITAMPASVKKPELSITTEKSTNALIINTAPLIYAEIEKLLKELDVKKIQVLIEAAIVELNMEKMVELGIELATATNPTDNGTGFGGTTFGMSTTTTDGKIPLQSDLGGLTLGIWKGSNGNIPFLLQAAQKDGGIDVKAAPRLLTNDNSAASINISDQIPYDQKTVGPDGTVTGITFGGYQTAGIELKITPHISEDNYLRLELEQKVGQFFDSAYSETRPSITDRTAKTTVTVPDRQTVVIGGLTRDNKIKTVSKIPLLGDIPLLGLLFRKTKDEVRKTNICIFISPKIMRQFSELVEETECQDKEIREQK